MKRWVKRKRVLLLSCRSFLFLDFGGKERQWFMFQKNGGPIKEIVK